MMTELLAPAGSKEALRAAFAAGADAVYIGGSRFGARAYADNPDDAALLEAIALTHRLGKKIYLTVNTLVKDEEMDDLISWFRPFYEAGADAVIVQDLGVVRVFSDLYPDMPLHASTQMTVTGTEGALFLKNCGLKRIVPARELSLKELKAIRQQTGMELETFIHGALCYSYSGACLMSSMLGGRSGNRGRCAGICRLPFQVEGCGFAADKRDDIYPMNMKDLCAADLLPDLVRAGISSFKIEGRMKKPEYTAGVTAVYRRLLDVCQTNKEYAVSPEDRRQLLALYNRDGFTPGYYFRHNGADMIAVQNEKLKGTRQQEAQKTVENIRSWLQDKQTETLLQRQVRGELRLRKGEPASFSISTVMPSGKAISVSVEATAPEEAVTRPVTKERILQQINKTGASAFSFSSIQVDMDPDLFIPMKTLNTLKHDGFDEMEAQIRAFYRRDPVSAAMPDVHTKTSRQEVCQKMKIRVLPHSEEQLEAVIKTPLVDGVYVPIALMHLTDKVKKAGKKCYLALPYILRQERKELLKRIEFESVRESWDGLLLRNLEETGWYLRCSKEHNCVMPNAILDATLYTMNMQAVSFFADQNLTKRTLPWELNFRELRRQETSGSELVVYGRTPLMFTAQCLKKTSGNCDCHPGWFTLKDRKKAGFPVYADCRNCGNIVYNSLPTVLFQEERAIRHLACTSLRLEFTDESAEEAVRIIEICSAVFSGALPPDSCKYNMLPATKGHFRRGVE